MFMTTKMKTSSCSLPGQSCSLGQHETCARRRGVRACRLPDASRNNKHIRDVFYRMGFNDQEIVALSGGALALTCCYLHVTPAT